VHWSLEGSASSDSEFGIVGTLIVVEPTEENKRLGIIIADIPNTLAREPPVKVIHQRGRKQCRVTYAEAFAVIHETMFSRLFGKIRGGGVGVVS
jgi:hypothetical protein